VLRGHGSEVSSIAFSADGNLLASGSKDGEILLWDSNSMTQAVPRFDFPADVQWVMPVPGHSAVKVQKRGRWWIWTLPSLAEATNPADYLTAPAEIPTSKQQIQSRDGRWSADLLSDGFVRIKDNLDGRESILKGHLLEVNGVAFTPDARRLVTTSGGAEAAKIWDVQTGRELLNLRGRGGHLRYVYWTDDESALIVNSSTPGYAQAWTAPTWEQIASEEMLTGRWPSAQVHPSATTSKRGKSVSGPINQFESPQGNPSIWQRKV
jgi:WD40 repeat protein